MVSIILVSWIIVSFVFNWLIVDPFWTSKERAKARVEAVIYAAVLVWFLVFIVSLAFPA